MSKEANKMIDLELLENDLENALALVADNAELYFGETSPNPYRLINDYERAERRNAVVLELLHRAVESLQKKIATA